MRVLYKMSTPDDPIPLLVPAHRLEASLKVWRGIKKNQEAKAHGDSLRRRATQHFGEDRYNFDIRYRRSDTDTVTEFVVATSQLVCRGVHDEMEALQVDRELRDMFVSGELENVEVLYEIDMQERGRLLIPADLLEFRLEQEGQEVEAPDAG